MKLVLTIAFIAISAIGFCQTTPAKSIRHNARFDSLAKAAHEQQNSNWSKDAEKRNAQIAIAKQKRSDSLITVLQSSLSIPKEKATAVMQIITQSVKTMDDNAKNQTITGEEKINRFKTIAKDRDGKIAALLNEEQVKRLREIMASTHQQVTATSAAPPPPPPANQ